MPETRTEARTDARTEASTEARTEARTEVCCLPSRLPFLIWQAALP